MKRISVESQIVTRYGIIAAPLGNKALPLANANLKRSRTRVHARQGLWVCRRHGDSAAHALWRQRSACPLATAQRMPSRHAGSAPGQKGNPWGASC